MTKAKRSTGTKARGKQGRTKGKCTNTGTTAARRQLWQLCERVEELMLAMENVAGGVLAWELGAISDRLHAAVVAG